MRSFQVDTKVGMKKPWTNKQEHNKTDYVWLAVVNRVGADKSRKENVLWRFGFYIVSVFELIQESYK